MGVGVGCVQVPGAPESCSSMQGSASGHRLRHLRVVRTRRHVVQRPSRRLPVRRGRTWADRPSPRRRRLARPPAVRWRRPGPAAPPTAGPRRSTPRCPRRQAGPFDHKVPLVGGTRTLVRDADGFIFRPSVEVEAKPVPKPRLRPQRCVEGCSFHSCHQSWTQRAGGLTHQEAAEAPWPCLFDAFRLVGGPRKLLRKPPHGRRWKRMRRDPASLGARPRRRTRTSMRPSAPLKIVEKPRFQGRYGRADPARLAGEAAARGGELRKCLLSYSRP